MPSVLGRATGGLFVLQCVSLNEGIEGGLRLGLGFGNLDLVQ